MNAEDQLTPATVAVTGVAPAEPPAPSAPVGMVSIVASIISTLLIRIAARTSFVILSFYIGKESESAALVVIIIEAFYISELLVAPIVGSLSDRFGRKRYMMYAPIAGAIASLVLCASAFIFPTPDLTASNFTPELAAVMLLVLLGRLLEGTAAGLNAPSNLGYLTDVTVGDDKLRVRVMTAYEVVTVCGIALAIPFGGVVWTLIGRAGFLVAIAVYALCFLVIAIWMKESLVRTHDAGSHGSLKEYVQIITNKRIFTFVPAWLAVMAFIGAWLTLILIILAYPTGRCLVDTTKADPGIQAGVANFASHYCVQPGSPKDADSRFPGQLLHGGFTPGEASTLVGVFGFIFIIGMGIWTVIVPKMRRTTVMMIGLGGLVIMVGAFWVINGLANNPADLAGFALTELWILLPVTAVGLLILAGFTPAALTHLAAIAETIPGKRGAVMGLYSVLLGVGQLVGVFIGGLFVDWLGFNGLLVYSLVLGIMSFASVMYMRSHNHDIDDHLHGKAIH
jgi:MFS family permease